MKNLFKFFKTLIPKIRKGKEPEVQPIVEVEEKLESEPYVQEIVNEEEIEEELNTIFCIISTPQFKNGKVWRYKKQRGSYNTKTKTFTPLLPSGHKVWFKNKKEFEKSVIKYL